MDAATLRKMKQESDKFAPYVFACTDGRVFRVPIYMKACNGPVPADCRLDKEGKNLSDSAFVRMRTKEACLTAEQQERMAPLRDAMIAFLGKSADFNSCYQEEWERALIYEYVMRHQLEPLEGIMFPSFVEKCCASMAGSRHHSEIFD